MATPLFFQQPEVRKARMEVAGPSGRKSTTEEVAFSPSGRYVFLTPETPMVHDLALELELAEPIYPPPPPCGGPPGCEGTLS